MELKDTLQLIRETRMREKEEEKRMEEFRAMEMKKLNDKMDIAKQKRERANLYKEEENRELDENVSKKMDEYMDSMQSIMHNKQDLSNKKLDKISRRNQYVDDKHDSMV
jgi:hypothetical protein